MKRFLVLIVLVAICVGSASAGERSISVEEYRDKMKAGWLGQMIGVGWGLPTEFHYRWEIIPEEEVPAWEPEMINQYNNDDLYVEMSFIKTLETYGVDVSSRQAGIDFANSQFGVVHANFYGRDALRSGIAPPDSGHPQFNRSGVNDIHSDDIDYQIESDYSGLIAPGMPNVPIELGEKFGVLMNYGDGVYAGQFMGAMISEAYFETDMEKLVSAGLKAIPAGSQYHECISDVLKWYQADPDDWQKTWQLLEDKYGKDADNYHRVGCYYPHGIDVKINGAYAVLGLLYGKGDLAETCKIAMRCGNDSDCNPSSAVGILATSLGTAGINKEYTSALDMEARYATTEYTLDKLLKVCEKLAREFVVDQGGRIEIDAFGKEWFIISAKEAVPSKLFQSYAPEPPTGNTFTEEEMAQMVYFSLASAFEMKFPGNPYDMKTSSCGTKKNPGFREEYNGRTNVIASIPIEGSRSFSFNMFKQLDPTKKYKMMLEVGHDEGHFWTLIVSHVKNPAWDRLLTEKISDETAPDGWKTFEIDLPVGTRGIPLEVKSWYDEEDQAPAYWSKIDFVEVEWPENTYLGLGAVNVNNNWSNGVISVSPALGVITNTDSDVSSPTGATWSNQGIRQEGGYIFATNGLNFSQYVIYEVDDPRTDYASYTNLDVNGKFQIWHDVAAGVTTPVFRLLSGHVEAELLRIITVPTIDIGDGLFHVGGLTQNGLAGNFTFMSNKTGRVVIDNLNGLGISNTGGCTLNFESGNTGSLTVGQSGSTTETMWWLNDMVPEWFSIDGVVETDPGAYLVTKDGDAYTLAKNPYSDHKRFIGQNAPWKFNPQGALTLASNWEDGVLPSGSTTGLVTNTKNMWTGGNGIFIDFAMRQVGGNLTFNELALRGGSDGSGITTLYEIDDQRTDYASYTNLTIGGDLVFLSEYGEPMELSLLSGHVEAAAINWNAAGKGTFNMGDGILHTPSMTKAIASVNMLAGGTGTITVDSLDLTQNLHDQMYLNFEAGNAGSFTLGSVNTNSSASGVWELMLSNSRVSVDGVVETSASKFSITQNGNASTIALSDGSYSSWIGGYGVSDPAMDADPDGDGMNNLMEYALGGNPTHNDAVAVLPVFQTLGNDFFHVHNERTDDSNLTYTVQLTTNLVSNGWNTNGLEFVGAAGFSNVWKVVTNKVPTLGKDQQFIRLMIEKE